jgi:predicted secreted protein
MKRKEIRERMRKFFTSTLMILLVACLLAGCAGEVEIYADSGQEIDIRANQEFAIALASNPTTGYDWEASCDENMLKLVESRYEPGEKAQQGLMGAGGVKYFHFKALEKGVTEITLTYKRPWEEESAEQKVFKVNIS